MGFGEYSYCGESLYHEVNNEMKYSLRPNEWSAASFSDPHWFRLACYLNANPDPDPGQTLQSQKLDFDMKRILYVGNMS